MGHLICSDVESRPEKIAQRLMLRHFAVACSRIAQFSPAYSEINR